MKIVYNTTSDTLAIIEGMHNMELERVLWVCMWCTLHV